MKMPSLIKKSIYRKMFTGGPSDEITGNNKINSFVPINSFKGAFDKESEPNQAPVYQPYANPEQMGMYKIPEENKPQVDNVELNTDKEQSNEDIWGTFRDSMYTGNAMLRGFSEKNARDQQNEYQQMNTANPLANMAYNDGRSKQSEYGYEQFADGGMRMPNMFKSVPDTTRVAMVNPAMDMRIPGRGLAKTLVPHYNNMAGNTPADSAAYRKSFDEAIVNSTRVDKLTGDNQSRLDADTARINPYLQAAMGSGAGYMMMKQQNAAAKDAGSQLKFKGFRKGGKKC